MKIREIKYAYGKTLEVDTLDSPQAVAEFVEKIVCPVKESFIAIYVNNKNGTLKYEIISTGTINESIVHPREVFRPAIKYNSSGIIIAHNHPSGLTRPSKEDIETTKRLVEVGKIIGIPIIDHIIVGNGFHSFQEAGMI